MGESNVWLGGRREEKIGETWLFSLWAYQNSIFLNWEENRSENGAKMFGSNCPWYKLHCVLHFYYAALGFFFFGGWRRLLFFPNYFSSYSYSTCLIPISKFSLSLSLSLSLFLFSFFFPLSYKKR